VLGWLMGLLSPTITERIRRKYRRRDMMQAVVDEMHGLRFIMVWVANKVRVRNLNVTDEFLDRILPIIEAYHGPDRDEKTIANLKESRQRTEVDRAALHQKLRNPGLGPSVRQYALPLFVTQLADLAICSLAFQRAVLKVRHHLDLFNQMAAQIQTWNDRTFGGLNEADQATIRKNIESLFLALGEQAEIIIKAINNLKATDS
jgi:hypothetical protein